MKETIKVIESSTSMLEAAQKLGIHPTNLYKRLKKHKKKVIKESNLKVVDE